MTRHILSACLAVVLATASAWADSEPDLAEQRELFLKAEQAIERNRLGEYRHLEPQLRDYPLYPYLRYAELHQRLGELDLKQIDAFAAEFGDSPLPARLRQAWLRRLAVGGPAEDLVAHLGPTAGSTDTQCRYAAALWKLNDPRAADLSERLWLSGQSQPRSCDPVFANWRNGDGLTTELVWERVKLALRAGNVRLARYLRRFLPAEERPWLDRWIEVRRDPRGLTHARWLNAEHPMRGAMLADGLRTLSRRDAVLAADQWQTLQAAGIDAVSRSRVTHLLALHLARTGGPEARARLIRLAEALDRDEGVLRWLIIEAMREGDWASALAWQGRLHAEDAAQPRWRYWRARALEGRKRYEAAQRIYLELAQERSFYGFLAADRVGTAYHFGPRPVRFSRAELSEVAALPGLRRAHELLQLDRVVDARREWHHMLEALDERHLQLAARVAHEWGWHDRVIFTLARAQYWDDLELRFPLEHNELVVGHAEREQINPAWAFAVIRQESAFAKDARSHAGAVGLMQLMPTTARLMANSLRVAGALDLTHAPTNIRLGVAYLNHVRERFEGHPVLSTAAYNAGPFRVEQWIPDDREVPADLWIEAVPFSETREYLKRILAYTIIYEKRLGRQPASIADYMPPIPSRTTLLTQAPAEG